MKIRFKNVFLDEIMHASYSFCMPIRYLDARVPEQYRKFVNPIDHNEFIQHEFDKNSFRI